MKFNQQQIVGYGISAGSWAVSVVLTLASIFALRDVIVWALAILLPNQDMAAQLDSANLINLANQCGVIGLAVIALVVIAYSTEHAFRQSNQARTRRRLIGIIVVECVIVLPVALLLWH